MNCADPILLWALMAACLGLLVAFAFGSIDFFKWRKPESLRNLLDDRDALRRDVKRLREKIYFMEVDLSRYEDRDPPPPPPGGKF